MATLGPTAHFWTLTPADLGLSDDLEHPGGLYDPAVVSAIFRALERAFSGVFYGVLEVGTGTGSARGRLHAHAVASCQDGPRHIRRGGQRCKPVTDPAGLYKYLAKPPEPDNRAARIDHAAALALTGRLPYTRRHFLGPARLAWAELNVTYDQSPPLGRVSAPSAPAPDPDRSPDPDTAPPPVICDAAPSMLERPDPSDDQDQIRSINTVEEKRDELEATSEIPRLDRLKGQDGRARPRTVSRPAPTPPLEPDRSSIKSITASEAECTSVRAYLAPTSGIDPAFTVPSALIVNSYPITAKSAKSTTVLRPVPDGVYGGGELPYTYPQQVKTARCARKNRSAPSTTAHLLKRRCTQRFLRGRDRERPAARGPPLRRAESGSPGPPSTSAQNVYTFRPSGQSAALSYQPGPSRPAYGGIIDENAP